MEITELFPVKSTLAYQKEGKPTDFVLELSPPTSKPVRVKILQIYALAQEAKDTQSKIDFEQYDTLSTEMCASAVVGWVGLKRGDEEIPYSKEFAFELIDNNPDLKMQIDAHLKERAEFFR